MLSQFKNAVVIGLLLLCGPMFSCEGRAVLAWADSARFPLYPRSLEDKESLRFQLIAEKQRTNKAQAALLDELHRQNLEAAKALDADYQTLLATVCRAHDLDPANCILTPDGQGVTLKTLPAAKK